MIKIVIKSFFFFKIKSYLNFFLKNIKKKYLIIGPFSLPKKIEKFTFLISPHVNKNARDQIQIQYYKTILYIKNFDKFLILFLLKNKFINGLSINYYFV
ncbi:30S ribosomal protein S10 [Candidatus Carsonella ruddii]|uniref:Ribosomal protein S10 n=1 Tax=Candidatus Carsonella ruddii PC isolate NHV TaxID=1202540 RepID=J3YQY6_CARRU|nr:30S ribosomal protein S10 [Candidatus Carsonella ruddii]AFP84383.1 ribosomal protein S10 [Candidatus Carsonella ruddii PC isolate NHV]